MNIRKYHHSSTLQFCLVIMFLPAIAQSKILLADGSIRPEFVGIVSNVTVAVGRDAIFTCNVKNLGRFRVTGDFASMFNLHIHRVQLEDRGHYMCQINTDPMMQQTAILDVNVPPDIKIERTSKDFQTKIGATVNLDCHAEGYPDPNISWLREDKKLMRVQLPTGEVKKYDRYEGNRLTIPDVGEGDMGGYLCIASNKVPPAMSKRVFMFVQFAPRIVSRDPLVGVIEGRSFEMRCDVTAYPKPIVYWLHEGNMILTNGHFDVFENSSSKSEMYSVLTVTDASIRDKYYKMFLP